jgi:hypothetical protein
LLAWVILFLETTEDTMASKTLTFTSTINRYGDGADVEGVLAVEGARG